MTLASFEAYKNQLFARYLSGQDADLVHMLESGLVVRRGTTSELATARIKCPATARPACGTCLTA
jgi:hypothetical protein